MFVPFKDENGTWGLRPALIGYIENDVVRRTLMVLLWPLTVAVTCAANYTLATLQYIVEVIRLTIKHVKMATKRPWDDTTWHAPRRRNPPR